MTDLEAKQGKRAIAVCTDRFICVQTISGRGLLGRDPQGSIHVLPHDIEDSTLGEVLLDALSQSRFLSADEARKFLSESEIKPGYEALVQSLLERYGYNSRRELFKHMISCNVKLIDEVITLGPTRHPKLEGWEGLPDDQAVLVQRQSASVEVGAALRLAFSRCEG